MIRKMQTTDIPRVAEIIVYSWRSTFRHILTDATLFNKLSVTETTARLKLELAIDGNSKHVYDDGIVKACFSAGPYKGSDIPNALEVWEVYVDPFFQRQNIGEKMMHYSVKLAEAGGFDEIVAITYAENKISRPFYEKLGFMTNGEETYSTRWGANIVRYAKTLS